MVESCLCHAATRYKGFCHGWGLKFTFETPIKNTVPAALLPRFLHAVAGGGHPLGDLVGADPLGMALGVRSFSVPRSSGLGGRQGEQGENVPVGTEVHLVTFLLPMRMPRQLRRVELPRRLPWRQARDKGRFCLVPGWARYLVLAS